MKNISKKNMTILIIILFSINIVLMVQNYKLHKNIIKYEKYLSGEINDKLNLMINGIQESKKIIDNVIENNIMTSKQFRMLKESTFYITSNHFKLKIIGKNIENEKFSSDTRQINQNIYRYFDFFLARQIKDQDKYYLNEKERELLKNISNLLHEYEIIVKKNKDNIEKKGYLIRNNKIWLNILKSMDTISQKSEYNRMINEQYFDLYH